MGNQQSRDGLQFCSTEPHPLATRFMVDKAFRVDYIPLKLKNTEALRMPRQQQTLAVHQQRSNRGSQQQIQEEYVDIPLEWSDVLKNQTKNLQVLVEPEVYQKINVKESPVFEGVYGDICLLSNGLVEYPDIFGHNYCEKYNPERIQKIFPKGISYGGISKSLWFKDSDDRDACFDTMIGDLHPSKAEVMANPEVHDILDFEIPPKKIDICNFKVFDGIQGNQVVVFKGNHVEYMDVDGLKHSESYKSDEIKMCFPNGICFGGLDRTIWFSDEIERDLCFIQMQVIGEKKPEEKTFPGQYGTVVLADNGVSFTSLVGERIQAAWYNSKSIQRVFPMGISGGGLPHSIWFKEMVDMENCFKAMLHTQK